MVKVTVVIPNYNHSDYLIQRIDSVLNQTFQDFEVLIFDDASTDRSLDILNTYKTHPKVSQLIVNPKNSGSPFIQWRKGIELAKGEFVWIAETDDFAEPNFLEETVNILISNPESSLVYTDARIVDEKGFSLGFWSESKNLFFETERWSKNYHAKGIDEIINYLFYKVTINNASSVLFKSKYLKEPQFLNQLLKFKNVGDLFTYLKMSLNGNISYFHLPLNNYRKHSQNVTLKNKKNGIIYKERLQCYLHIMEEMEFSNQSIFKDKSLKKPFRFIIKKNVFQTINFNHSQILINFVTTLNFYKIISKVELISYIVLFKLYKWNHLKSKQISRRLIKLMTNR
tara:strand:+ start:10486 stop:11508 length:1023 start_codon:yes stop_codon:yes gene_type:complete